MNSTSPLQPSVREPRNEHKSLRALEWFFQRRDEAIQRRREQIRQAERRIANSLWELGQLTLPDLLRTLDTREGGLTNAEAAERLQRHGPNEITHERPPRWYAMLFKNFINPFVGLLTVLAIASAAMQDIRTVLVLSLMIGLSVLLRFVQEYRSSQAAERLKAMVRTTATVRRTERAGAFSGNSHQKGLEVALAELVPGDIIQLSAGDMIPADVRLIATKDLFVSQSVLTGESLPVEKYDTLGAVMEKRAGRLETKTDALLDMSTICFMGTNVVSGTGLAVVLATGDKTFFGAMARGLTGHRAETSFDRGINSVSWLLIKFTVTMIPIVLLLNGFIKGNWTEAVMFALAVGVGLTPEMLPMVVTGALAKGAVKLSGKKVIVKRLNSIQNIGAIDILCTDKTGTLTCDRVVLERYLDIHGRDDDHVLRLAYLNSYFQSGLKNLLDAAVLKHKDLTGWVKDYVKFDEIPFDFVRRRMSVVVHWAFHGEELLVCKGAVEETLSVCSKARVRGEIVLFTEALREEARRLNEALNMDGMRILAVAYKEVKSGLRHQFRVADESDLIFCGYIAFLDPPKEDAAKALTALRGFGVGVKIITGDNELVTRKICSWVGLTIDRLMPGSELERLTDEELAEAAARTTVFVKTTPMQKARIIRALQSRGHTVGYLGDGINDAAALRDADVGISVDTAVDIAKESADIILLEKSLLVLEEAIIEGRTMFGNIVKYIKMTASSNFGNVFSVLGASAFLPFLPMQALQLLVVNLCYDLSQTVIPWDRVDPEFIATPRKWEAGGIARFMVFIGPISSIFDYATFAVMWWVFMANAPDHQALFQSGWFVESLLSQTLIVHLIRTQRIPFVESWAATPLIVTALVIMGLGQVLPYTGFGRSIGLVALPMAFFGWLWAILLAYCVLTQFVKGWYIRQFHEWI